VRSTIIVTILGGGNALMLPHASKATANLRTQTSQKAPKLIRSSVGSNFTLPQICCKPRHARHGNRPTGNAWLRNLGWMAGGLVPEDGWQEVAGRRVEGPEEIGSRKLHHMVSIEIGSWDVEIGSHWFYRSNFPIQSPRSNFRL
jgi:hypothetical protein